MDMDYITNPEPLQQIADLIISGLNDSTTANTSTDTTANTSTEKNNLS
jgi:hypothetical protein